MNLVKWFRKNNKKVMAVVVIVIMVGFVGGEFIRQLGRRRTGLHKTVAYFADNKKITRYDLQLAQRELEILRNLRIDDLLKSQDLRGILLGELLFAEQRTSPALINHIKRTIRTNEYRISDKQISDIYRRSMPSEIYWFCLKNEAQLTGIRISNEEAGKLLGKIIPQLFNGTTYPQLIGSLINRQGIPQKQILTIFGKLLAVFQHAQMTCSIEDVTSSQIRHRASWENETIDVEFVRFDSAVFTEAQDQPGEEKLVEHFNKYKKFFAGAVSEENPYGFGYKLADRVQLEYIACQLDDISSIVTPPTQQETEDYYQKNAKQFVESVPADPNDPNASPTERTKSYAEVASIISNQLLQDKINSRAERILQEAKTLTEAGLEDSNIEPENLSTEQYRQLAGDYEVATEQLCKKHKIKVYTGQTGLLSAVNMQADEYLGRLYIRSYGYNPAGLTQIVFAIDELKASELGPFDVPKPRMYENIGPVRDILGQIMLLVRVIKAEKASEPENANQSFSTKALELELEQDQEQASDDIYSVKEKVAEDLKKIAAMDITKSKAEEFIDLAVKDGWESTLDKFNELYGQQAKQNEDDPNAFMLQNFTNLRRISSTMLETLAVQTVGNPTAQFLANERKKQGQLVYQLYSLVPQDSNTVDPMPLLMEFKPDMSYYCLKNIFVKRLEQAEYEKIKVMQLYKEDHILSQSLAAVYFSPKNILKRMNFRLAQEDKEPADTNAPAESKGAS